MPAYAEMNHFGHAADLPAFYRDGETDMHCLRETMRHILDHGYAHHIHRLMVVGLFALLYGVDPRKFHDWLWRCISMQPIGCRCRMRSA